MEQLVATVQDFWREVRPRRPGKVDSLETLSLFQVLRDLERHAVKFALADKESSEYLNFLRMYSSYVGEFFDIYGEPLEKIPLVLPSIAAYRKCLHLIYNPHTEKVHVPVYLRLETSKELLPIISSNCQNAWYLSIFSTHLDSPYLCHLLTSMKCLKYLRLRCFEFFVPRVRRAIASSFARLQVLDLSCCRVNEEFIFSLCCKEWRGGDLSSRCFFTGDSCSNNALQLRCLMLGGNVVSPTGVACLLTHVHTLRKLTPMSNLVYRLSEVISRIDMLREHSGMPGISLQLEELCLRSFPEEIRRCLRTCPKLQSLCLRMQHVDPFSDREVDESFAESEFCYLTSLTLECTDAERICSEKFSLFWENKGHQLNTLIISPMKIQNHMVIDLGTLQSIVGKCPNLTELKLKRVSFPTDTLKRTPVRDSPKFFNLQYIYLEIGGDTDFVNNVASYLINLAPYITSLELCFPTKSETFVSFLTKKSFPLLRRVIFSPSFYLDADLKIFLWSENCTVEISRPPPGMYDILDPEIINAWIEPIFNP